MSFKDWSHHIGELIEDNTIDTNELFRHTLRVHPVNRCPQAVPVAIDWDDDMYKNVNYDQILSIEGVDEDIYLFDASLEIVQEEWNLNNLPADIHFQLSYGESTTEYRISYSSEIQGDLTIYRYHVEKVNGPNIAFRRGHIPFGDIVDYFNTEKRSPVFFFANGAMLYANNLVELRNEAITLFPIEELIDYDWQGVTLSTESMDWPHKHDSIQYYMWQRINDQYELVFDDDGSGEVADIVGVNHDESNIYVDLYHLKFAHDARTSQRIDNFYEVCGQAQKSLKWKNVEMNLFHRLIYRATHTAKGENRILKGSMELMQQLSQEAAISKRVRVNLHIVQPGFSKADAAASPDILQLLGVVKNYAFEVCNADLKVYCSS